MNRAISRNSDVTYFQTYICSTRTRTMRFILFEITCETQPRNSGIKLTGGKGDVRAPSLRRRHAWRLLDTRQT